MPKKFTVQQKETYVAQFYKTHLTQTAFCKQHSLRFKTFNRWLNETRFKENSSVLEPEVASPQPHFIPIECVENKLDLPQLRKEACQDIASAHQSHQSKLWMKVNAFELEMSLDLLSVEGQNSFKSMISILAQVHIGSPSHD